MDGVREKGTTAEDEEGREGGEEEDEKELMKRRRKKRDECLWDGGIENKFSTSVKIKPVCAVEPVLLCVYLRVYSMTHTAEHTAALSSRTKPGIGRTGR